MLTFDGAVFVVVQPKKAKLACVGGEEKLYAALIV